MREIPKTDVFLLCRYDGETPVPTGEVFLRVQDARELELHRNSIPDGAKHVVLPGHLFGGSVL